MKHHLVPSRILSLLLAATAVVVLLLKTLPLDSAQRVAHDLPPDSTINAIHYKFFLQLSDSTNLIRGHAEIELECRRAGISAFYLHLVSRKEGKGMTVTKVGTEESVLSFRHQGEILTITLPAPVDSARRFKVFVDYHGIPADGFMIARTKYGERSFFADNWPNRAHHWLPLIDHLSDKATCEFIVDAPRHYRVIANGLRVGEELTGPDTRRTHWRNRVPIPPKVMVIGAAPFVVDTAAIFDGVAVESWVYPQDSSGGFREYAQAVDVFRFFEAYIGPYPYQKLANVQSKIRHRGMENAGNIFYHENSTSGNGSSERLIAHEVAHQWFGNSVTESQWSDLWLSEGFSTYFAAIYLEGRYGRDRLAGEMKEARERVIRFASEIEARPLRDTTITNLNELLNVNSYQKGAWVLHMLRREIGDLPFQQGIRLYYARFRDANASTADFRSSMEAAAGRSLGDFFTQWVLQPGYPRLKGEWSVGLQPAELVVVIEQVQAWEQIYQFPLDIAVMLENDSLLATHTVLVTARENRFQLLLDSGSTSEGNLKLVLDPGVWMLIQVAAFEQTK